MRNPISKTRGLFYSMARMLGWVQTFTDALSGHGQRAVKKLANKVIGRKIGSKIYFR